MFHNEAFLSLVHVARSFVGFLLGDFLGEEERTEIDRTELMNDKKIRKGG